MAFNVWAEIKFFGKNLFELLDFLTTNIMLPVGGLLIAVFAGWVMSKAATQRELEMDDDPGFRLWHLVLR